MCEPLKSGFTLKPFQDILENLGFTVVQAVHFWHKVSMQQPTAGLAEQELKNNSVALQLYENASDEARDEAHDKNGAGHLSFFTRCTVFLGLIQNY